MNIEAGLSLDDFLIHYYSHSIEAAVAINQRVVPRRDFAHTLLNDKDNILFIVPMQGG